MKEKFMSKIKVVDSCWIYQSSLSSKEYIQRYYNGKMQLVHRIFYQLFKGEIPDKLLVCHKCDNRHCVNPDHLWLGTHKDNAIDAFKKGRLKPIWGRKKTKEEIDKIQKNRSIPDQKGEKHYNCKLNNEKVLEIRKMLNEKVKYRVISEKYGIDICSIADIKFRRTWKHI